MPIHPHFNFKGQQNTSNIKPNVYSAFGIPTIGVQAQFQNKNNVITVKPETNNTKNLIYSKANFVNIAVILAAGASLLLGAKKLIPNSTNNKKLISFLNNQIPQIGEISENLRNETRNIFEKSKSNLQEIFTIPEKIKKIDITNNLAKINSATDINELLKIEDETITTIYEWYGNAIKQQKPQIELLKNAELLKDELLKKVENLVQNTNEKINELVEIPDNIKTKNSSEIIKEFNENVLFESRYKISGLKGYFESLFNQSASALNNEYKNEFDKLVTTKNNLIKQVLECVSQKQEKLLSTTPEAKNVVSVNKFNNVPKSITQNEFFRFIQKNADSNQLVDFVKNSMGKNMSFKDIEFLEQRILLRQPQNADSEVLQKFDKFKNLIFKFIKTNANSKNNNLNINELSNEQIFELINSANWLKDIYGADSIMTLLHGLGKSPHINLDTTIFKILQKQNEFGNKSNDKFKLLLTETDKDFFSWEQIKKCSTLKCE